MGKYATEFFFLDEKRGRNGTNKIDIAGAEVHEQKVLMSFTLKSSFSGNYHMPLAFCAVCRDSSMVRKSTGILLALGGDSGEGNC